MNDRVFNHLKLRDAVKSSPLKKSEIAKRAIIVERTLDKYLCGAKQPGKQTSHLLATVLGIDESELYKKAS